MSTWNTNLNRKLDNPLPEMIGLTFMSVVGLLVGSVAGYGIASTLSYSTIDPETQFITLITGQIVAFVIIGTGYIRYRHNISVQSYIKISKPDPKLIAIVTIVGLIGMLTVSALGYGLIEYFDISQSENAIQSTLEESTTNVLIFILITTLVVAPFEEFFFRGVILGQLLQNYSAQNAIILSSVLFGSIHITALIGGSTTGSLMYILIISVGSCVLGYAYYYTENLLTPIFIHALYNITSSISFLF